MSCADFMKRLEECFTLLHTGMRKQGNAALTQLLDDFRASLQPEEQRSFLDFLCAAICDGQAPAWLRTGGNGLLPHGLQALVREHLLLACDENSMPHLRWAYQLLRNDPACGGMMDKALIRAYRHPACDHQTAAMYLTYWLDVLSYGAHHYPEGCCISEDTLAEALASCREVLADHPVPEESAALFRHFEQLYREWQP